MFFYIQTKNPPPVRGIFYRRVRRLTAGKNSPPEKQGFSVDRKSGVLTGFLQFNFWKIFSRFIQMPGITR